MSELNEKRILVTGGAGFIGSHLTEELLRQGHSVIVLDNLSSGILNNLPKHKRLTFVEGDIRDFDLVDKLVKRSDMVFHLAEYIPTTMSYGSGHVVKYSIDAPLQDFDVSARGTLIVLNSAKKYGRKFIFTSTAAVYGGANFPLKEDFQPIPASPYGASKLCAEEYVRLYYRIYGLPTSIARLFNVYGPKQSKYVMYDVLLKLKQNQFYLEMLGTGDEIRDFVYVDDVVKALILIAQDEFATGEVYNVGSGKPIRINEMIHIMLELLGIRPEVKFAGSSWKGDVKNLIADISKISMIGYRPECSLSKGLVKLINWFKSTNRVQEGL
ncbi:SDR family NAD(P)-dependent oxidoreductase [Candidatus Bathyarchaeota archaeon]|nr:SDR family NAD(P)-dependent oxidoreductase [Candidatus Bathyarchaeota archaeon]